LWCFISVRYRAHKTCRDDSCYEYKMHILIRSLLAPILEIELE
jgi:hypothetical protein